MVDAKADIATVGANVVDAIRNHLAEFLVLEVVGIHLDWLAFRSIIATGILELANQLLLRKRGGGGTLRGALYFGPDIILGGGWRDGGQGCGRKGRSYEWSYERSRFWRGRAQREQVPPSLDG